MMTTPCCGAGGCLEAVAVQMAAEEMPDTVVTHNHATILIGGLARAADRCNARLDCVNAPSAALGVVQLKSIEPGLFKKQYADGVPPLWIACQALTEAKLVGAQWAAVGVLAGRV